MTEGELAETRRKLRESDIGIGNFLRRAIEAYPHDVRLITPSEPFETAWGETVATPTLRDWARLASRYARGYCALSVGRADPVAVYGDLGPKYLLHFLALSELGAIPVLVNGRMPLETAIRYMKKAGVVGVFTGTGLKMELEASPESDFGFVNCEEDFRANPGRDYVPHRHHPDDPAIITHSSGTTGFPKATLHTHGGFFHPMIKALERPLDQSLERLLCALPPAHNSAIGAVGMTLVNGEEIILLPNQDGSAALQAIKRHRPTAVIAFPATYVDLLGCRPGVEDLSSVMMWINLGDAAHEIHIRRMVRFGSHGPNRSVPGSQFVDGLGSSEMGSMLFRTVHTSRTQTFNRCVGKPQPWIQAAILDGAGRELANNQPGFLAVRGPGISPGWWNDSKLTFKSRLAGYFLTGDIAYRDDLGRYFHLDRTTDTIAGDDGNPIYTLVYEEFITANVPGLLDFTLVAVRVDSRTLLIGYAVIEGDAWADSGTLGEGINAKLAERGMQRLDEVRISERDALPVGVTGKVLKARMRKQLQSGEAASSPAKTPQSSR